MNVTIYVSISKNKNSKKIAESFEGDVFEITPTDKIYTKRISQLMMYGYKTVFNRRVSFTIDEIKFRNYDTVTLVSPIWAGRVCQYMRKYLETVPFKEKNVILVGSCEGGYKNYFDTYEGILDPSNTVIDKIIYEKGIRI
jgi:flavodoxin